MIYTMSRYSSLSAFGAEEYLDTIIPSGFKFPTESDYVKAVAGTVKSYVDWGENELKTILNPPVSSSVSGLKAALESTAGGNLAGIMAGAIAPGAPPMLASMLAEVLDGVMDIVVDSMTKAMGDQVTGLLDCVPVLGQLLGIFIEFVKMFVDIAGGAKISPQDDQAATQKATDAYNTCLRITCGGESSRCINVRPTMLDPNTNSVTRSIADTFRPFAYALHEGRFNYLGAKTLPWCGPFPFAALCGGETEGFLWKNRNEYNSFLQSMRTKYNDPRLGIPQEAQRRIWKSMKSICQSVNDPTPMNTQKQIADGGRSLFPLMLDTTYAFCADNARRSPVLNSELPGVWTVPFVKDVVAYLAPRCQGSGTSGGAAFVMKGGCGDPGAADIIGEWSKPTGFVKLFSDYDIFLDNKFGDSSGRIGSRLTDARTRIMLSSMVKRSALVLKKESGSSLPSFLTTVGMVGAGALAWQGAKYLALNTGSHRRRK